MDEEHTPSLIIGTDHRGEGEKIKLKFLTNKNTLINYGENIFNL
jgi:hypothetical protein